MTFPAVPRTTIVEAGLGATWVDLSADVYQGGEDDQDAGVHIGRGRTGEASKVSPTTCALALANPDGKYASRNPLGPYYGQLKPNTPLRCAVRLMQDPFTRTVSNGWGTSADGHPWTIGATASDYAVNGSAATHTIPSGASAVRLSYLADTASCTHVVVVVTASLSTVASLPTPPATTAYNVVLRGQDANTYYYLSVGLDNTNAVTLALVKRTAFTTTVIAAITVPGLTPSMTFKIMAMVEGQTIRGKVWQSSGSEPLDWQIAADDPTMQLSGWVGIRSDTPGDAVTRVFSYDNLEVRVPRAFGEVPSWPTQWPIAGTDAYTDIEAAGILSRLSQGEEPLQSPLARGYLFDTPTQLVAYWPCEDPEGSTSLASAVVSGVPAMAFGGAPDIAGFSEFACSNPIPVIAANSGWTASIPNYATSLQTGWVTLRFLVHIPAGTTTGCTLATLHTTGSLQSWYIYYRGGTGDLSVTAYSSAAVALYTGPTDAYAANDQLLRVTLTLRDNFGGGGVDFDLETYNVVTGVATKPGTYNTAGSLGIASGVTVNIDGTATGVALGHISVQANQFVLTTSTELRNELRAWQGERAARRIQRLCTERGIPAALLGDPDASAPMGPQSAQPFLTLLEEAVDADMGLLYESLGRLGLAYRSVGSFYNQLAGLGLNYTTGDLAPPFAPDPGTRYTRNTITVQRAGGSTARYVETDGPRGVTAVGVYPESPTVNLANDDQTPHQARWRAHLGTVDDDRYPQLPLDLTAPGLGTVGMMLDLGSRVAIDGASPAYVFDQISQLILGYTEQIRDYHHKITLSCAPESPYRVWELEHTSYGRLDTSGSVLAAAIGTGDTALSIATISGPKWYTGGQLPMPIVIDGEQMSVTAIADELITFVAAGTAATANNASVVPGLPAGHAAGDLLLVLAAIHNVGTGSPNTPAGYTLLFNGGHIRLFGKIDNGAEAAPTVSFSNGAAGPTGAQMAAFRGKFYNLAGPVINAGQVGQSNPSAVNINYPGLPLLSAQNAPSDNCLILVIGWERVNWTSVAAASGMAKVGDWTSLASAIGQGVAWDYLIQTSAADTAANALTVTGGGGGVSLGAALAIRTDRQAFTVTRNGNGALRAHAADAAVALYTPTALAL